MIFSIEQKEQIVELLKKNYEKSNFSNSQNKYAKSIGLAGADISNLFKGNWKVNNSLVGEGKWIKIARLIEFQTNEKLIWNTASTEVSRFINLQLEACKNQSMTAILCDDAGIGKTHTAKLFAKETRNVFYLDCSITPRKIAFVRKLAQTIGLDNSGKIDEIVEDIIYALQQMDRPLIILDEAGDLDHLTILLLKRLYNGLEDICGFYMLGADGLRSKIDRGIKYKKNGFVEFFSRFGKKFSKVTPQFFQDKQDMFFQMAEEIIRANGIADKIFIDKVKSGLVSNGLGDMRKVKREVLKLRVSN